RRFAESLDGVYRRGEIYLRWLQRLTSVAFGTPFGRFLTLYFALPFGGAFVILEGLQHLLRIVLHLTGVIKFDNLRSVAAAVGPAAVAAHGPRVRLTQWESVFVLGVFLLAMLHLPPFRRAVMGGLKRLYRGVRWLLFDLPQLILEVPLIRAFFQSRLYLL